MTPGGGPRYTGTLRKSNRRNDRNREQSATNQFANRSVYHGYAQHSNNLYQLDWNPVSERQHLRITKNSNTRSVSSVPSTSHQDITEFAYSCGQPYNYCRQHDIPWQKMVLPTESHAQSPPRLQGTKPSNVNKMPDRSLVEFRLNEIRDCIRATSTLMESLNQSSDPRAQAQYEKLSVMLEDLHDSERKLFKLLEQYQNRSIFCENGENGDENEEVNREAHLRKKMEDLQRKLADLQEHQASLVGMQLRVTETLNEARQTQQALIQQENQNPTGLAIANVQHLLVNVEQLESETAKLAQLQSKKKQMDHLVAELQAVDMSDRGSCSSDGSRNVYRDKVAELEAMKAQLAHLKALMEEATRGRECLDNSDTEPEVDMNGEATGDADAYTDGNETNASFERRSDNDETSPEKTRNTGERPPVTVEEIQAVTREIREQSALLQSTRAELLRYKRPPGSAPHSNSASAFPTPPPSLTASICSEKKQSNNSTSEADSIQGKKRQIEDFMRKDSSHSSSVNRDVGPTDVNSHRSSNSHISHTSTPANVWPPSAAIGGPHDQSVDGVSADNLMDMDPQTTAMENALHEDWWTYPPAPPINQPQHGSNEYYRQLVLGSQAQQLQMMGTTLQQCCQLLQSQQRELQAMRKAITQLQLQLRQTQLQ